MDDISGVLKFYLSQQSICLCVCAYKDLVNVLFRALSSKGIEVLKDETDTNKLLYLAKTRGTASLVVLVQDYLRDLENAYIMLDLRKAEPEKSSIEWKEFFHVLFKGDMVLFQEYSSKFQDNKDNCISLILNLLKFKDKGNLEEEVKNSLLLVARRMKEALNESSSREDIEFYLSYLYACARGRKENIRDIEEDFRNVFPR